MEKNLSKGNLGKLDCVLSKGSPRKRDPALSQLSNSSSSCTCGQAGDQTRTLPALCGWDASEALIEDAGHMHDKRRAIHITVTRLQDLE